MNQTVKCEVCHNLIDAVSYGSHLEDCYAELEQFIADPSSVGWL